MRAQVGSGKVILGLSGGVDSSVAAALLHEAIGDQLHCIFVDNGLLRKNEARLVEELFGRHMRVKLKCVDASRDVFATSCKGSPTPSANARS